MAKADQRLSPELRRRLVAAVLDGPAERAVRLRRREIAHFVNVDRLARLWNGLSDADVALWSDIMLDSAEPGTELTVLRIIEDIKAARAAKLSS